LVSLTAHTEKLDSDDKRDGNELRFVLHKANGEWRIVYIVG
jgi:hypothetical protein